MKNAAFVALAILVPVAYAVGRHHGAQSSTIPLATTTVSISTSSATSANTPTAGNVTTAAADAPSLRIADMPGKDAKEAYATLDGMIQHQNESLRFLETSYHETPHRDPDGTWRIRGYMTWRTADDKKRESGFEAQMRRTATGWERFSYRMVPLVSNDEPVPSGS